VNERALDLIEAFNTAAQRLSDIVRLTNGQRLRQNYIHLRDNGVTAVEGPDQPDGCDVLVVVDRYPHDTFDHLGGRAETRQRLDVTPSGDVPADDDVETDDDGTQRVRVLPRFTSYDTARDSYGVREYVVEVILSERFDPGTLVLPTHQVQPELDDDS